LQKDHLLQLLKTLSAQEKKTFSSQMNVIYKSKIPYFLELYKQYTKLINKGLTDEEVTNSLSRYLKRNNKLFNDLANVRNQLREKILLSLVSNGALDNPRKKIRYSLNVIEFLLGKKLFDQAEITINQIEKFALLHDENNALTEITNWQLFLAGKKSGKNYMMVHSRLVNKLEKHQELYALELSLQNINQKLTVVIHNDLLLKKKENKRIFKDIYKTFDFDNFPIHQYENTKNTKIVSLFYRIKNLYYRILGDYDNAYIYSKRLVTYFELNTTLSSNFEIGYIKSICGFTRVCQRTNNHEELEESLLKVRSIYEKKSNYDTLEATCDIGILHYLNTHQYKKAIELADLMKNEWEVILSTAIDAKLLWYCHTNLILFWVTNHLSKFEHWLNEGLNIQRPNNGKAFYFSIRMFDLMYDFDNRNFNTFNSKLRTFEKTLQNNEHFTEFEKIVVSHFKTLHNIEEGNRYINLSKKETASLLNETFQSLKNDLENLQFKTKPLNHLEIILWCESHIENKTIKELFETEG